jgi:hypothetical protein
MSTILIPFGRQAGEITCEPLIEPESQKKNQTGVNLVDKPQALRNA